MPAAPAYVQSAANQWASALTARSLAFPSNVTSGNLIAILLSTWGPLDPSTTTFTVTDTQGNTYTLAGSYQTNAQLRSAIFYTFASASGANTVTVTPNQNTYISFAAMEYSGVGSYTSQAGIGGSGTSYIVGNVTASAQYSLRLAVVNTVSYLNSQAGTNGHTARQALTASSGFEGILALEKIVHFTGSATGSGTVSGAWNAVGACFAPSDPPPDLAPHVSTVKPAGAGDYTTLAGWWSIAGASDYPTEDAECYAGDPGVANITGTKDAAIYAAAGQSVAIDCGGSRQLYLNTADERVADIALSNSGSASAALNIAGTTSLVERCTIDGTGATYMYGIVAGGSATIRNCRVSDCDMPGIYISGATAEIDNCTVHNCGTGTTQGGVYCYASTVASKNTVVTGSGTGDFINDTGTLTLSNCASSDATADDFGGTGNLVNQVAADLFTDPDNGDFTPKAGSPLIDAGAALSADFTDDILGNARPSGAAWDIGAFEYQAAAGGGGQRSSACISPFHFPGPGL